MFLFFCIYLNINVILSINIVLPFKQLLLKQTEIGYNSTLFLYDNLNFICYSIINIGEPKQKLILLFNQNNNEILVHKNNINCNYFSKNYNYLSENSKSSKILKVSNYTVSNYNTYHYLINDNIELYTNKKCSEKIKTTLKFYYLQENNNNTKNYCADFGFPINKYLNQINSMTFIQQLKDQKLIDDYLITIEFNSTYEGFFHIGNFPHIYDKDNFKEYQIISTYSIPKKFLYQFQLSINNIYISYINNSIEEQFQFRENKIYFNLDLGIILAPKEYYQKINELFFNKYFETKICKTEIIEKKSYDPLYMAVISKYYYVISCDKKQRNDKLFFDIKSFPSLNFYHREMNFTFSLSYKELFKETNDNYYFLIFDIWSNDNDWEIGIPFFRKYQTTFNIDTRKIYFYNKNIMFNENKKNNNKGNNVVLIIICFGLSIILLGVAFYLGKKINEHRKLRMNELEDNNYNYLSSMSLKNNSKIIEMNIQNKKSF